MASSWKSIVGVGGACLALPALGAWLAGRDLSPLLRFPPPLAIPAHFPRFSWWACALVVGIALAVVRLWFPRMRSSPVHSPILDFELRVSDLPFPIWGWFALIWTFLWWHLAWTRYAWFAWGQRYTFTPLWLGFIVAVNAFTWQRIGSCLLTRAPGKLGRLFVASAVFWWVFEWLNRFVHNWHYLGAEGIGAREYVIHASICFSTVLPAVASMRELLGTFSRLAARLASGPPLMNGVRPLRTGGAGVSPVLIAIGGMALALTGAQPLYFYPALWAAPLLLAVGLAWWRGEAGWWRDLATGDWREAGSWALAALSCGFFWEMWNVQSFAKWIYTVPFVDRWHIFEMPLLGYTGYLTFGLECAIAVQWVLGSSPIDRSAS